MQKFRVPQFIDVENKILGPITSRQFIIMIIGLVAGFIAYKLSDFSLFLFNAVIILVLVTLFAFIKVNGAPFHIFLLNYIKTLKTPNVRVWKRSEWQGMGQGAPMNGKDSVSTSPANTMRRRVSGSHLSELSLIVDTGGTYQGESIINQQNEE